MRLTANLQSKENTLCRIFSFSLSELVLFMGFQVLYILENQDHKENTTSLNSLLFFPLEENL